MAPSTKLQQSSTSAKNQKLTLKKSAQRQEKSTILSFYLPNVRLLLRRQDFSLKDTMRTTNCTISIPHQCMTPGGSSSMVSISGKMEDIIKTRSLLQGETIMKYAFAINKKPSDDHPFVRRTEKVFNVKVEYLEANGYMKCLVLVKGLQKNWEQLQEATERLLQIFYFDRWEYITVNTILELPVQCHSLLKEKTNFIRQVEQDTKTHIVFPNVTNETQGLARNLQIKICGNIQGVFTARQILINRLPASILISSSNNIGIETIRKELKDLRLRNGLSIEFNSHKIIIGGIERNYDSILKVGREMLNILDNFKSFNNSKSKSILRVKIEGLAIPAQQQNTEEIEKEEEKIVKEEYNHHQFVKEDITEISTRTSISEFSSSCEEMDDNSRRASFGGSSSNSSTSNEGDLEQVFTPIQNLIIQNNEDEDDCRKTFTVNQSIPSSSNEHIEGLIQPFQKFGEIFPMDQTLRIEEDMPSVFKMDQKQPSDTKDVGELSKTNPNLTSIFDSKSEELKIIYEKNEDILDKIFAADEDAFQDMLATALNIPIVPKSPKEMRNLTNLNIQIKPLCTVIRNLLDYLELGHYYTVFERNHIGIQELSQMNEMDLENIGIGSSYARELILAHIRH